MPKYGPLRVRAKRAGLHDVVENFALVVDGPPKIVGLAADPDEDLVQMPSIRRAWSATADPCGIGAAELERPPALILLPDGAAQEMSLGTVVLRAGLSAESANTEDYLGLTHALAVAPSATAFVRLRRVSGGEEGARGFIGFGDPELSGSGDVQGRSVTVAIDRSTGLARPDVLKQLFVPLAETTLELEAMASRVEPGMQRLYLRAEATEANVKRANLASADALVFATHAIVSGDLDHLNEPALVLPPQ
jgi:hypothetical protein